MTVVQLQIDKGIPMPRRSRKAAPRYSYPWRLMQVGDSLFVPFAGDDPARVINCASVNASVASRTMGGRFETDLVEGGVRIWRTR